MDGADQDADVAGTQAAKRPADDELGAHADAIPFSSCASSALPSCGPEPNVATWCTCVDCECTECAACSHKNMAQSLAVGVRKKRAVAPAEQAAPTPPPDPAAASADGAPATSAPTAEPVSAGEEAEEGRDDGSDSDSDSDSSEDFGGLATDREDRCAHQACLFCTRILCTVHA